MVNILLCKSLYLKKEENIIKYFELEAISKQFQNFTFISRARRIENNTIELSFNKEHTYFFNMTRGASFIYKDKSKRPLQSFNAPFDKLLHSLLSSSTILNIEVPKNDRVLRFTLSPKSAYKEQQIVLQFEFTGRHTNAILLDDNEITIEALRHIDADSSFRVIRPGIELLAIPPFEREEKTFEIENIEEYLTQKYIEFEKKEG